MTNHLIILEKKRSIILENIKKISSSGKYLESIQDKNKLLVENIIEKTEYDYDKKDIKEKKQRLIDINNKKKTKNK